MASESEQSSYLYAGNSIFIEELYHIYLQNPSAVDESWRQLFSTFEDSGMPLASWTPEPSGVIGKYDPEDKPKEAKAAHSVEEARELTDFASHDTARALMMINAYRVRGHLLAKLDPLGLEEKETHPELDPATYGFGPADMDREVFLDGVLGLERATIREVLDILRQTYSDRIGVEFMHIQYPEQKAWIQERVEGMRGKPTLSADEKKEILGTLIEVEAFEDFSQRKYPGMKRFSLQGGDSVMPGLESIIHTASKIGVEEIVIGMPHRGRMNVLTTTMGKPYSELLSIFHGNLDFPDSVSSSGDVKYHLGASHDREMPDGKTLHLSLTANPSHLEAVNPVVCGKVRAKQDQKDDAEKTKVMALTLHGDAAFAGQGSVAETLALSELRGYRTGGTVHVIVNNQIGFTTSPKYSRFTPYPSDVAKMVQAPIFHVNGDDPEAVVYVCKLATEFRQEFKRDVVIDVFCYRKYGHNEGDEPMFTQPLMYNKIKAHPSSPKIYAEQLTREGVVDEAYVKGEYKRFDEHFEEAFESGKEFKPNKANWLEGKWTGFTRPDSGVKPEAETGVELKKLKEIGKALSTPPENFNLNRKLERILKQKAEMIETGENLDWATGEALAFGSLLKEGYKVRLSGQDSGRGTFSQRHSVFVDQKTEDRYQPLNNLGGEQAPYEVIDSNLSELAILGFEYGYSLAEPDALTLWEGQFGDFANGAQMIIDQFISSGEIKWLRMSGLVMLLPHGYEGQGPEHSSARLERFLQLCGEDNMQVLNCTTPANYFHALRRQLHRKFRKPLIIMTPKSLLRHKMAVSSLKDMEAKTCFSRVIPEVDKLVAADKVKRVILTSGKVYYDLLEARRERNIKDMAIVRVEQYYPFPHEDIKAELKKYKNAEVYWCQEEPENMGAWRFIGPRIGYVLEELGREELRIKYAGRREAASPAAGYLKIHEQEQQQLIDDALIPAKTTKQKKAS
ncbi:MAG: 2-oxoglutarate dehydrogenase E1 component [Rickettsiales bacterium]|nr:2-oxoglutarate dehydrogenase E1 component [Rickettsiales bacterium]